ncbi:MAG: DUF2953 domain-containing protein [Lachnospiraceae bacterium]|nr:DUF2953 domain-containing protein [Lachnospiraceae bacterium]
MIQILLLILKIIGITLLVILGLVLLILALVLFVPVFYRVRIVHNPEKTQVNGRVRFLFPVLSVTFQYIKKFTYRVRVFGFSLLDSEKPKKEKKEKENRKENTKKKKQKKKTQKKKQEAEIAALPEAPENGSKEKEETVQNVAETASEPMTGSEMAGDEEPASKPGFFEKIRVKIQKVRETVSNIINKVKKLLHQKDEVLRILNKPESKLAISFVFNKLKHLLKHILPGKVKGYVAYGADNPATTGQVLGILGIVYARTGQLVEIRPNFEEAQLECDVELRGRVQLFTLLVIAVKVALNQDLRRLITEFKNVKNVE